MSVKNARRRGILTRLTFIWAPLFYSWKISLGSSVPQSVTKIMNVLLLLITPVQRNVISKNPVMVNRSIKKDLFIPKVVAEAVQAVNLKLVNLALKTDIQLNVFTQLTMGKV